MNKKFKSNRFDWNRHFGQKFHLVDNSPWPFIALFFIAFFFENLVIYFDLHKNLDFVTVVTGCFVVLVILWTVNIIVEAIYGSHSRVVYRGLKFGMLLFIVSEILFFFAFFWAFFHMSVAPSVAIGAVWPPKSIQPLDIWGLPFTNTLLLLSSGVTLTIAHHNIMINDDFPRNKQLAALMMTIFLGFTFLYCQFIEYKYGVSFSWKENVYPAIFFVTTGFHGFHVMIGLMLLLFCCVRLIWTEFKRRYLWHSIDAAISILPANSYFFTPDIIQLYSKMAIEKSRFQAQRHLGFEAAAWYWHFVDVVWIFLFITVYWWGG
jgi:heme/copper-type cytochrome/quinol oxidase subunit 3